MSCGLNNSLSSVYFGQQAGNNPMKNGQLNFGVVVPPDKLPNASIYDSIQSTPKQTPKKEIIGGGHTMTAGKVSAGCAIGALILSIVSLLPFIRKH